jgi:hypothetical protein
MRKFSSKDKRKAFAVLVQIAVMGALAFWVVSQFMDLGAAPVYDRDAWTQRDGFVAISYIGLTRDKQEGVNSVGQFTAHLQALKDAGYTFITGQDIVNFYNHKPLPEKAVYLMLEGGRKDSAIFGQQAISRASAHGAFFTYTETMLDRPGFFVNAQQLATIADSPFWEVGSEGYKLIPMPEVPGKGREFYLSDYKRDAEGKRAESDEAMTTRLEEFYRLSWQPVFDMVKGAPYPFIFPPANSFYDMPEEVERINRELIKDYFDLAFTREGAPFNADGDNVLDLSRMRINPDMDAEELLLHLRNAHTERYSYGLLGPENADEWITHKSAVVCQGLDVTYVPEERDFPVPAILQGTHAWENVELSVMFPWENSDRRIYLRYAGKTSFVRITAGNGRLIIHERVPGGGLRILNDSALPTRKDCRLRLILKGNRLWVFVNDVLLPEGALPLSRTHRAGQIGIAAVTDADTPAVFGDLQIKNLPTLWRDWDQAGREAENLQHEITASIIHLPRKEEGVNKALAELMQSAGVGEYNIAALPSGDMDADPQKLLLGSLSTGRAKLLWSAVMVSPEETTRWEDVSQALQRIRENDLSPVLHLDLAQAERLAQSQQTLDADKYVLDFRLEDMPKPLWLRFAHRHNRNDFLYLSVAPTESDGLYVPRKPQ